jgi:DnaJ-class molecular chaperone
MNAYKTLGVQHTATDDEVRAAFHAIARQSHPDAPINEECFTANEYAADLLWKNAQEAYEELKTPAKRAAYDAKLRLLSPVCKRCKGTKSIQQRTGWSIVDMVCPVCNGEGRVIDAETSQAL